MIGTSPQLSASDPTSPREMLQIQNLIRDSLDQKLDSKRKLKDRDEMHEAIISMLQEFCSCFMVVGFDLEKEPIVLSRASSPMEGEALISLVRKVFADVSKR